MRENVTRGELAAALERLLLELEGHASDYHHVTPPVVLEETRALLERWKSRRSGKRRPRQRPEMPGEGES